MYVCVYFFLLKHLLAGGYKIFTTKYMLRFFALAFIPQSTFFFYFTPSHLIDCSHHHADIVSGKTHEWWQILSNIIVESVREREKWKMDTIIILNKLISYATHRTIDRYIAKYTYWTYAVFEQSHFQLRSVCVCVAMNAISYAKIYVTNNENQNVKRVHGAYLLEHVEKCVHIMPCIKSFTCL